jgi:hypothetical protein
MNLLVSFFIYTGLLFPDITFKLIPGESSVFSLVGVVLWIIYKKKYNLFYFFLFAIFILSLFSIIAFVYGAPLKEIIKQVVAYLQISMVFAVIIDKDFELNLKYIPYIAGVIIVVGIIQRTGIFSVLLDSILPILIPRGSGHDLSLMGRGATLLSSEPSHSVQNNLLVMFLLIKYYLYKIGFRNSLSLGLLFYLIILVLSGAGTGLIYISILLMFIILNLNIMRVLLLTFLIIISSIVLIKFNLLPDRLIELTTSIFNSNNLSTLLDIVIDRSGFRFPSVIASFNYALNNFIGYGPGSWFISILDAYRMTGIDISQLGRFKYTGEVTPTKPYSFFANLFLEFGFIAMIPFIGSFIYIIINYFKAGKIQKIFIGSSFLFLIVLSSLGKPTFIAILGIILNDLRKKIKY